MMRKTIRLSDDAYGVLNLIATGSLVIMFMLVIGIALHRAGIV